MSSYSVRKTDQSKIVIALGLIVYSIGYLIRPSSVTNGRVALIFFPQVIGCSTETQWLSLDFPVRLYTLIYNLLPFRLDSIYRWDVLIFIIGLVSLFALGLHFSKRWALNLFQSVFFLAAYALCGVYIFIFNKDVLQFFIYLIAFGLLNSRFSKTLKVCLISLVFIAESLVWRQYYIVLAAFLPLINYWLNDMAKSDKIKLKNYLTLYFKILLFAFIFLTALRLISFTNYQAIVDKHGVDRESYTATAAISGIQSWIPVDSSTATPLVILNWVINFFRLLFPIELFRLGPYYWVFASYQLCLSIAAARSLSSAARGCSVDENQILVVALYFAFVICSALFEPDFGSWVRHETASLPFLLLLICYGFSSIKKPIKNYSSCERV